MLVLLVNALGKVLAYIIVSLILVWGWFQWTKWDFLQLARKLPAPVRSLPVIGHAYLLLQYGQQGVYKFILDHFSIAAVKSGLHNVTFWCGPEPVVIIQKLEDVQKALNSPSALEKGHEYEYIKYVGGNGLLTSPVDLWKQSRRQISPLFQFQNVEQLMTVFNANSRELVTELTNHVDGGSVDMLEPAMSIAFKTVCQLIFGMDLAFDRRSKAFKDMLHLVELVPALFIERVVNPLLRVEFIFQLVFRSELKTINSAIQEFTEAPLKISKHNYKNKQTDKPAYDEYEVLIKEGTTNLIDVYSEFQKKFPHVKERQLIDEMATLYCTGTDTVGLTVSSCLLVLGHQDYKQVQDRVYQEIMSVVGPDDNITPGHISRMQYLDQVYKETLRWSLIVPYIIRRTTEDLQLSDCTVPADSSIYIGLAGVHMDPNNYPNPEKFDPERFSAENSSSRNSNAFMPFSAGKRMCIAKTYSDHLIKTMLIHVLRRFQVSTDMDIYNLNKKLMITYVNSDGYLLKFQDRK